MTETVNDAPVNKNADMGLHGQRYGCGTRSRRHVLLDDNFATIVNAVEGRTVLILKNLLFISLQAIFPKFCLS